MIRVGTCSFATRPAAFRVPYSRVCAFMRGKTSILPVWSHMDLPQIGDPDRIAAHRPTRDRGHHPFGWASTRSRRGDPFEWAGVEYHRRICLATSSTSCGAFGVGPSSTPNKFVANNIVGSRFGIWHIGRSLVRHVNDLRYYAFVSDAMNVTITGRGLAALFNPLPTLRLRNPP